MALQVWLPLNGNLNNQGLNNTAFTGSTTFEAGKLGQAGVFGTAAKRAISSATVTLNSQVTIAFWIKIKTWVNWGRIFNLYNSDKTNTISCVSNTSTDKRIGTQVSKNGTNLTDSYNGSFDLNTWYHFAMVVNGTTKQHYINGSLVGTATLSDSMVTTNYTVMCGGTADSGTPVGMDINDFRVYDHALSPKEIEILSRGLVCHYPLSNNGNGQANLLKNSNFTEGSNGLQGYTSSATSCVKQTDCVKIVSGSASSGIYTANYDSVTTGDMATFSAYVKADADMTVYIGVDGSGIGNCQAYTIGNSWQRISISKAKTTNNANLRVYGSGTFYVRHMKYELGSTVTPWCPNSADSIYSSMGYSDTTEYDVSGYGYNGTKNGTMTYSSDTARYSVSTTFNGSNTYIEADPLPSETATIACWLKTPWVYVSGAYQLVIHDKNTGLAIGWSGSNMITYVGSGNGGTGSYLNTSGIWQANKWMHVVVVKTGSTTRDIYINGVKQSPSGANYWGGDLNKLNIGNRHISGSYSAYFNGQISDFRAYATALSATQVAELYNTAVSVANNGTLMGYELVEG